MTGADEYRGDDPIADDFDAFDIDELSDEAIPWPRKEHNLRAESANDRAYAFLAWQQGRGAQGRIMGYRRAAEILAEAMLADPRNITDLDTVIFPYAACWRHYVELQLKVLIKECQELLDKPVVARGGHDVQQLWSELRPLLREAYPTEGRQDLKNVARLIKQLSELDPDSQHFRYGEDRDGSATLAEVGYLDIASFHQAMLGVAHFFEAVDSAIDHDKDRKNEALQYEWEARREYEEETSQWNGTSTDPLSAEFGWVHVAELL